MSRDMTRLLRPETIAIVGGGAWCAAVIAQCQKMGFAGQIWRVHPKGTDGAYRSVAELPAAPDACFVGVNRFATIDVISELAAQGAGGAVCFASGFSEALAEDDSGADLQAQLVAAAGDMPILGPNCYGFINALDGALLWPDQHGCQKVSSGVAILTQSSNISINLTMQQRGLPIAYMVACGNMAQSSQAQIAEALLDDPRVTAIGVHIEGFKALSEWESLAQKAFAKNIPIVAIKVGASEQAQAATISHTASLAGSDAGAQAFLDRLGIPRLRSLPSFLEALKLLHVHGALASSQIGSISCSGGEASLIADMAVGSGVRFPALTDRQSEALRDALGPMVALNNPLDYHTYIWRDEAAMTRAWAGLTGDDIAMTLSVVDYPVTDASDWIAATNAALGVRAQTGAAFGVVATLPELMPLDVASTLIAGGVVPFMGLAEALDAIESAASLRPPITEPVCVSETEGVAVTLNEAQSKAELGQFGLALPRSAVVRAADDLAEVIAQMTPPFAVKGIGLAHKSDHGAVRLGVDTSQVAAVAAEIGTASVLVEEMIDDTVVELIVGVVRDPAHGFVLTLGAGGVLTEVLRDTKSLLLPTSRAQILQALEGLQIAPVLNGYRGKSAVDKAAILDAVSAVQSYVLAHATQVEEVEINPLICTADRAVAVDALIKRA